jgi:hypothetical protein
MLAKCANKICCTPFRRLSEGKLFMMESDSRHGGEAVDVRKKAPHHIEYFWLCNSCAAMLTLIFDSQNGISTVPLPQAAGDAVVRREMVKKKPVSEGAVSRGLQAAAAR